MLSAGLQIVLLLFAVVGYAGAGASLAASRHRHIEEGKPDLGLLGVAAMLMLFGALCTVVAVGFTGVLAFGAVVVWASYVLMAQHVGLFTIEAGRPPREEESPTEEPRRAK